MHLSSLHLGVYTSGQTMHAITIKTMDVEMRLLCFFGADYAFLQSSQFCPIMLVIYSIMLTYNLVVQQEASSFSPSMFFQYLETQLV